MKTKYDLIIIGGGAAAFNAAIKANMHGVRTLKIERAALTFDTKRDSPVSILVL